MVDLNSDAVLVTQCARMLSILKHSDPTARNAHVANLFLNLERGLTPFRLVFGHLPRVLPANNACDFNLTIERLIERATARRF